MSELHQSDWPALAVAAIVKDEAVSLLEWLAFHRVVGVSHFLLADDASTDGTRELLQHFAARGWVTLIDAPRQRGTLPQLPAYQALLSQCPTGIDLVAFIDADEFLLPLDDGAPLPSLLTWLGRIFADDDVSALALNWACFGSAGARFREDRLVIERFTRRARRDFGPNHHYKTIVRPCRVARFANPHHVELRTGRYRHANGQGLQLRDAQRQGVSETVAWEGARINHYIVKSVEEFLLGKSRKGSAATPGYEKHRDYFQRHDRNEETCELATRLAPRVRQEMQDLLIQLNNLPLPVPRRCCQEYRSFRAR